jgi:large subunit ribosomal protein L22
MENFFEKIKARVVVKDIRMSSKKFLETLNIIRNKPYDKALAEVVKLPYKIGRVLYKGLISAYTIIGSNPFVQTSQIKVGQIFVTPGPISKRQHIKAKSKIDIRRKRSAHLTIVLEEIV